MKENIPDALVASLSECVAERMGLHFPPDRWEDLRRGFRAAALEFGFKDVRECLEWLQTGPLTRPQIEILASALTVGETYFLRDMKCFETMEEHVIPALVRARRSGEKHLRLWSTGCCTGEEPYSLAIGLTRAVPDLPDWKVTVLGTDINPHFLRKAAAGVFGEWAFRDVPDWWKEKYFHRSADKKYRILPEIRKMVTFEYLNLAEDVYPALLNGTNALDVIFCRNVLMYFSPDQVRRVLRKLHHCLVDDGWLAVSPSETFHVAATEFGTVSFPGAVFHRKAAQEAPVWRAPVPRIAAPGLGPLPVPRLATSQHAPPPARAAVPADSCAEALVLYEQGRYAEAADSLMASFARHPADARAIALLVRIFANQGRMADALTWCEKLVATDKVNPVGHYLQAVVLQEQGAMAEAIEALKRALYLDQDFVLAHFDLGHVTLRIGRLPEARRHMQNALHLLRGYRQDDVVPESEGMTAGRLSEIVMAMLETGVKS